MLIAGSILGVVGAILAVPFAAVIKIATREAGAPRRERMNALRSVDDGLDGDEQTADGAHDESLEQRDSQTLPGEPGGEEPVGADQPKT